MFFPHIHTSLDRLGNQRFLWCKWRENSRGCWGLNKVAKKSFFMKSSLVENYRSSLWFCSWLEMKKKFQFKQFVLYLLKYITTTVCPNKFWINKLCRFCFILVLFKRRLTNNFWVKTSTFTATKSLVSRWAQDLDRDLWARIDLGWHKEEEAKGNYFRNSF